MAFMEHLQIVGGGTKLNGTPYTAMTGAFTEAVAVGGMVVMRVSTENTTAAVGETTIHAGVADQAVNTWTKAIEWSVDDDGAGEEGQTVSIWWARVTTAIEAGHTMTATFSATTKASVMGANAYDVIDAAYVVELVGANGAASPHGVDPLSVVLNVAEDEELTWIAAGAHAESEFISKTYDASYTEDMPLVAANGNNNLVNSSLWGQYRQLRSDTDSYDVSCTRNFVLVLAAFRLVEPDPPPPEPGNREYRRDFESAGHQLDETTTDRRVDAVSWNFRTAYATGPVGLENSVSGIESHLWRARAVGNAVYIAREDGSGWGDETLLTTATGSEEITELDLAFTELGKPVLVAERPTGSGGAAEVWIYFFNDHYLIDDYIWQGIGAGTSPRCCSDYFPSENLGPNVCPPEIDVQMVYMKPSVGMVRREESDRFTADNTTPLSWSAFRRIQKMFRTDDRRLAVWYSQRNLSTGRYVVGRVDSVPYDDSLLRRPTFEYWSSPANDVLRDLAAGAWNGASSTDDYYLRVQVSNDVDAIEVAATADLIGGTFDQQEQESAGGFSSGGFHDFTFSVTVGGGTCSLRAFRARTRRTIGEVTCYSPWRYTVIAASAGYPSGEDDLNINCDRDLLLDINNRIDDFMEHGYMEAVRDTDQSAAGDDRPAPCGEHPYITTAPYGYWFVGGVRNYGVGYPATTHIPTYTWRLRAWAPFMFADENGTWSGTMIGDVITGGGGGTPVKSFDWPSTRFPIQFPEDDGTMPALPATLDIIGSV